MLEWNFASVFNNLYLLGLGLLNTLKVTGPGLLFGISLGLSLALSRLSAFRPLSAVAAFIIEFFRMAPPLVQLFWFFFALPILIDVRVTAVAASIGTWRTLDDDKLRTCLARRIEPRFHHQSPAHRSELE